MLRSSSICASFLYSYLMSDIQYEENGQSINKKTQKLRCLADTLQSYGGVLSKLSQILLLNDQDSTVFSDCKPFSKEKTIEYFKKNYPKNISDIDFNVYKSGSVGQVHRAKYNNKRIVLKVQYVGLAEQTRTDLNMLDKITSYLYYFADMKNAMVDIKTKMYEELDYNLEAKNQQIMYNLYKNTTFVEVPKIIPELCSETILGMSYVKGEVLNKFIDNASQEEKNIVGMNMVKFIFTNIYDHHILYSDVHYGNFLVKKDYKLCVLDYGCLHTLDEKLVKNLRALHKAIRNKDKTAFYVIVEELGIIKPDISPESKKYIYDYFKLQYEPWTSEEFEFTDEWLDKATDKETDLMKEWILPQDMVYFNKIPYGAFHVLTKLKLKGKFSRFFDQLLGKYD